MTNFETLLRTHDPARELGDVPDELRARVLAVPEEIAPGQGRTRRLRVNRRRILAAVAAMAVLVAGIGYATMSQPATAEAREVLSAAADQASDPPAAPQQYWEVRSDSTYTASAYTAGGLDTMFLVRKTRYVYYAVDGTRPSWWGEERAELLEQLSGRPSVYVPPEPDIWTIGVPDNELPGGWQQPTLSWLAALPRDTEALRARLYQESQGNTGPDDAAVTYAADLLRTGRAPDDLRAALFRVLQTIPGTKVTDRDATMNGRSAVAIGRNDFGQKRELLFAKDTGEFLGERTRSYRGEGARLVDGGIVITRSLVDDVPEWVRREARMCTVEHGAIGCSG